jgi:hypothetical protein
MIKKHKIFAVSRASIFPRPVVKKKKKSSGGVFR